MIATDNGSLKVNQKTNETNTTMKKIVVSLAILAMAISVNAQDQQVLDHLNRAATQMKADGKYTTATVTVGSGAQQQGSTNVTPRHTSPPAKRTGSGTGTAKVATGGVPKKKINGIEYFDTPYGLALAGDTIVDQNGLILVVTDDGTVAWTGKQQQISAPQPLPSVQPQPAPNPNNNTGTATASEAVIPPQFGPNGEVLVYNPSTKTWDIPEGVKQAMAAANASGGSGQTSGGTDNGDPLMSKKTAPNEIVYDRQGNIVRDASSLEKLRIRRGYDSEGNPTDATVAWMNNRNGGGGLARVGGVVGVNAGVYYGGGVACAQPVVYRQPARAGYGPAGYCEWDARQRQRGLR